MKDPCSDLGDLDKLKLETFVEYFEDAWIRYKCYVHRSALKDLQES